MRTIREIKKQYPVRCGVRGVSAQMTALRSALKSEGYVDLGRDTQVRGLDLAVLQHISSGGLALTEKNNGSQGFAVSYWEHRYASKDEFDSAKSALPEGALALKDDEGMRVVPRVKTQRVKGFANRMRVVTRVKTQRVKGFANRKAYRLWDWDGTQWIRTRHFIVRGPAPESADITNRNCRQMLRIALRYHHAAQRRRFRIACDRSERSIKIVERATNEAYHVYAVSSPRRAHCEVKMAYAAFRMRKIERVNEVQIEKLKATTFVSLEDSTRAGNCESLSLRFAREVWERLGSGESAVRADVILAMRNDAYTRRAVQAAIARKL